MLDACFLAGAFFTVVLAFGFSSCILLVALALVFALALDFFSALAFGSALDLACLLTLLVSSFLAEDSFFADVFLAVELEFFLVALVSLSLDFAVFFSLDAAALDLALADFLLSSSVFSLQLP